MSKGTGQRYSRVSPSLRGIVPPLLLLQQVGGLKLPPLAAPQFVGDTRLSLPSAPFEEPAPMPRLREVPAPVLPPVPVLQLPTEPAAARLEDAPAWLWGLLGAMLAGGGGRMAPALLAAPFAALQGVQERRRDMYERGVERALQQHRLALAGWEAETARAMQGYREAQDAAAKAYEGELRAWLADRAQAARAATEEDRQAFRRELEQLKIEAAAARAAGRDASALERAIAGRLAAAASNPSLSPSERMGWQQALQYYLTTGELIDVPASPSARETSPVVSGLLAAIRNPQLSAEERAGALQALLGYLETGELGGYGVAPSVAESLLPHRAGLMDAQAALARARVPEAQARAQYLLARANEIRNRNYVIGRGANNPRIQDMLLAARREVEVYGDLAARALSNYRSLELGGDPAMAARMWQEYEEYANRLERAIERLRQVQQQTGTQLVPATHPTIQQLLMGRGGGGARTQQPPASQGGGARTQQPPASQGGGARTQQPPASQGGGARTTPQPQRQNNPLTGRVVDVPVVGRVAQGGQRRQQQRRPSRPPAFAGN